jgi:hypothetical protein
VGPGVAAHAQHQQWAEQQEADQQQHPQRPTDDSRAGEQDQDDGRPDHQHVVRLHHNLLDVGFMSCPGGCFGPVKAM